MEDLYVVFVNCVFCFVFVRDGGEIVGWCFVDIDGGEWVRFELLRVLEDVVLK